jgi:hypothetical protein
MELGVHPPSTNSAQGSASLLSGNDHGHGLYLACFGELFAFSLGERLVNEGPAILRQIEGPDHAFVSVTRDDKTGGTFLAVINHGNSRIKRLVVACRLNERRGVEVVHGDCVLARCEQGCTPVDFVGQREPEARLSICRTRERTSRQRNDHQHSYP